MAALPGPPLPFDPDGFVDPALGPAPEPAEAEADADSWLPLPLPLPGLEDDPLPGGGGGAAARSRPAQGRMRSGGGGGGGGAGGGGGTSPDREVYGAAGLGSRLRPTMISAKYRLKEERRKVLKLSIAKLRRIDDPESSLRRSVLLNNTVRRLQREAREEKLHKQFPNSPRPALLRRDAAAADDKARFGGAPRAALLLRRETADKENASPERTAAAPAGCKPGAGVAAAAAAGAPGSPPSGVAAAGGLPPAPAPKRTLDEAEECDVQDVLSQFYMPPTPRMLTSIDEEEPGVGAGAVTEAQLELSSLAAEPPPKRPRRDEGEAAAAAAAAALELALGSALEAPALARTLGDGARSSGEEAASPRPGADQFSCGHSSMFGELQSVVYHSLIASLES